jgi:glycosyltransferase involved in cell wall biosynthesis
MTKVSIILPVYNGEKTVAKAIKSLVAQDYRDWELIIIDDCSTDDTEKIVRSMNLPAGQLHYLKNTVNIGQARSMNEAIKNSTGEYIARIDADDEWSESSKLTQQVNFLEADPTLVLIGTGAIIQAQNGQELFRYLNPESDKAIKKNNFRQTMFSPF